MSTDLKEVIITPLNDKSISIERRICSEKNGILTVLINKETSKLVKVLFPRIHANYPWTHIRKSKVLKFLTNKGSPVLENIKLKIIGSSLDMILFGHDPENLEGGFVACLTEDSTEHIMKNVGLYSKETLDSLKLKTTKEAKLWQSQGSEEKILQWQAPNERPLRTVEAQIPLQPGVKSKRLQSSDPSKVKKSYAAFKSIDLKVNLIKRRTVDVNLQTSRVHNVEIQTTLNLPNKMWTQWEPQQKEEDSFSENEEKLLQQFLSKTTLKVIEAVHFNTMLTTYDIDYARLTGNLKPKSVKGDYLISHILHSYREIQGVICCHAWHPTSKDILAVAYRQNHWYSTDFKEIGSDVFESAAYKCFEIIIWNIAAKRPVKFLKSPNQLHCLQYCPYNPHLLAGGCDNGLLVLWDMEKRGEAIPKDTVTLQQWERVWKLQENLNPSACRRKENALAPTVVTPRCHERAITGLHWLSRAITVNSNGACQAKYFPTMQILCTSEDGLVCLWDLLDHPAPPLELVLNGKGQLDSNNTDQSLFKPLHRLMTPKFKVLVNFEEKDSSSQAMISASCVTSTRLEELTQETAEIVIPPKMKTTALFQEDQGDSSLRVPLKLFVGTLGGAVSLMDMNKDIIADEEQVTLEYNIMSSAVVHDGPVLCIIQSPFDPNIVLSVGGHTFAIWSDKVKSRPILLQHTKYSLSSASWSLFRRSMFYIYCESGTLQIWDLVNEKCILVNEHSLCPGILKALSGVPICNRSQYLPIVDARGTICFYSIPTRHTLKEETSSMGSCFDREVTRTLRSESSRPLDSRSSATKLGDRKKRQKEEEKFLKLEQESLMKPERSELDQLRILAQSPDKATRRAAERRLQESVDQSLELLSMKSINKKRLLQEHQPVVQMEDQEFRKKLLQQRRQSQQQLEHGQQCSRIELQSTLQYSTEAKPKLAVHSSKRYFQEYKNLEAEIFLL